MTLSRGTLLIFIMSICFFLCSGVSNTSALFRDDINAKEAEESVVSEREKSRIRWEERKRKAEEEESKFEAVTSTREKEVLSTVAAAKEPAFDLRKEIIIGVVLLLILIAIIFKIKSSYAKD